MRRTILVLTILISVVYLIPASVVIESGAVGGSAKANLLLVMDEVKKENFGLSSQPVDINNSPVPITAVELEGQLSSNDQTLIGSKTVYAYWDIASVDKVKLSVSISNPMTGEKEKQKLDWCCYSDIGDKRYYVGAVQNVNPSIDTLPGSQSINAQSYGGSYVIYDESITASPSYARIDSEELNFRTDNAYPSDSGVPADTYTGTLVLTLEIF